MPSGEAFIFRSQKPIAGIAQITVVNKDANTIRLTVQGKSGVPIVELYESPNEGLIFSVASATGATQQGQQPQTQQPPASQPESETQPQRPSASGDEPIELVVTGQQDRYRAPDATTATKTDTPIRDIPASIQVVPRQVLEDQKAINLIDALRNVSGVSLGATGGLTSFPNQFTIRGFSTNNNNGSNYVNGIRIRGRTFSETANIEQVEVLKGPASVLYGQAEPGGIINTTTKQPLAEPYYGLIVGLLLIIVGLTGSLLVFQREIDQFLVSQQFGQVIPQEQRVPIESVVETVKTAYASQPELKLSSLNTLPDAHLPYRIWLEAPDHKQTQVFVNPYTGTIMGSRQWERTLIGFTFKLHYELLAGKIGEVIVGIAAFLLFILSITGIILWPGWRKLILGFKIKWNGHPKRTNFDIHKVAGIIAAVFLTMIAFTGVCWNFWDFSQPAIHAATFTPMPPKPVSQLIEGKSPLALGEILKKADVALPNAITTYISLPKTPEGVFRVGKKYPQETWKYGRSQVYLDQYTGKVIQLKNGLKASRADQVLNSFAPMHYGTYGGLPTRILYIFVGLSPLILSITGFVMWWYRYKGKNPRQKSMKVIESSVKSLSDLHR
ncbi:MAG: PepSY domain-containing protein [Brasilonema octagenarum HA4186-MV1]|nr:PepSY domain-containing protein [Brasilonema octagenarum HA4186-MV1]